jgi:hypothetical protein
MPRRTVSRPSCLGIKHLSGAYDQIFITVRHLYVDLLMWGALSDERTGLSFAVAASPRQRSHSRVRVPWQSWPYFTFIFVASCDSQGYGGGIRPCLHTGWTVNSSQSQSHIATDGRSVSKSLCRAPSGAHDQIFITVWQLRSCFCGASSLTRGRVCVLYMLLVLASAVFLGSESLGLTTIFYCLRFETSLFVASYDSQGHCGDIRPRLHTSYSPLTDTGKLNDHPACCPLVI